jgi:GTP pyrophosphokinase
MPISQNKNNQPAGAELIKAVEAYNPDFDKEFLQKAIDFAVKYHGSQLRQSGEPYYQHPISVAMILAEIKLDVGTIVSALLHDTIEDTEATYELIEKEFSPEIAHIVEGVTKLDKINFRSETEKQAENFRKFLLAISQDIRVLIIKLADRLHNMRTLEHIKKPQKRFRIAKETMDIYAPLAERIGINKIKIELQHFAFKELYPDAFASVVNRLEYLRNLDENLIERTTAKIQEVIDKAGITGHVDGREKMPYSIWLKMQKKKIGFENVTDIIAFRIITKNIDDCYRALGAIHTAFKVLPSFFDDYISNTKANGYQSIHTIVMGDKNQRMEIQIRTEEMHEIAEYGVAAHWSYKQNVNYQMEGDQYRWLRQLLSVLENASDPDEVLENTKLEMYHENVFCFTPKGDLIVLPKDATPVDFAFTLHSALGRFCAGAKVNGRVVPLRTKLKNGDQVEIIKAKVETIIPVWESFVKTGQARAEIRKFLRGKKQGEYLSFGKNIVNQIFLQNGEQLSEEKIIPHLEYFKKKTLNDFYIATGESLITKADIIKKLFPEVLNNDGNVENKNIVEEAKIPLKGLTKEVSVSYANCCNPLPGERIVGIQTAGGVIVHRAECKRLEEFVNQPEKWLDLRWDENSSNTNEFLCRLDLMVENKRGTLAELTKVCADNEANIYNMRIASGRGQDFCKITIDLELNNATHLSRVEYALKANPLVSSVKRYIASGNKLN